MKNIKYILVTHVSVVDGKDIAGPAHTIRKFLESKKYKYIFIRHSITGAQQTFIEKPGDTTQEKVIINSAGSEIINRIREGFITIKEVLSNREKQEYIVYLGVDPLNCLWGYLLKKLGIIKFLILFSADYCTKRYENKLLNQIYFAIDSLCARNADLVLAVSQRILDVRLKSSINPKKLFLLPNSPALSPIVKYRQKKVKPTDIIMVGLLAGDIDHSYIFKAFKNLMKKIPDINLTIIGSGNGMTLLKKTVQDLKLGKNINFLAPMSHDKLFQVISGYGIGLALYSDDDPCRYYCDSMKARDYLAMGLPVILSGDFGTATEIQKFKAGIIINSVQEELEHAIEKLVFNIELYKKYRDNAIKLASKYDNDRILDKLIKIII